MIKEIFCLLTLILAVMCAVTCAAFSITIDEQGELTQEIINLCHDYNKPCSVRISPLVVPNAFTHTSGTITITQGLLDKLNYEELKAVAYHEVGHHVLDHCNKLIELSWNNYPANYKLIQRQRFAAELEADAFAARYVSPQAFESALNKLVPQGYYNKDTLWHPSPNTRVQIMYQNYNQYYKSRRIYEDSNLDPRYSNSISN